MLGNTSSSLGDFGLGHLALDRDALPLVGSALYQHRMTAAVTFFTILILYRLLYVYNQDSREPHLIKPRIPLIGHAVNVYRHGSRHFVGIA